MKKCRELLPAHIKTEHNIHLPYLGGTLDSGMAAILAEEVVEAIRYVDDPDFYCLGEDCDIENGRIWLGAADDTIMRKSGIEFVDGSGPGFCRNRRRGPESGNRQDDRGRLPEEEPVRFYVRKPDGHVFFQQFLEAGVQIGWNTRLVPFGPDISAGSICTRICKPGGHGLRRSQARRLPERF